MEGIEEVRACKTGRNGERGESGKERKREEGDRMMKEEGEKERKEGGKEGRVLNRTWQCPMRPERGKGVEKVGSVRQVLQTSVLTPQFAPGFYYLT